MSKIVRKFLAIVLFWAIFFVIFSYAQRVITPKDNAWANNYVINHLYAKDTNAQRSRAFEQLPKDSVDVAFLGSSIVFCGINPIQLYEQKGIASHDYALGAYSGILTPYMISLIYETQHPKVIVLDTTYLHYDSVNISSTNIFPYTKLTFGKVKFALQCGSLTAAIESLVPMFMCHQNWPYVNVDDFKYAFAPQQDDLLGMIGLIGSYQDQQALCQSFSKPAMSYADEVLSAEYTLTDKAKQQMIDFRDICLSMGAQPLLISCPSVLGNETTAFQLDVENYASTLGIPMMNFNIHREGLHLIAEDFSDSRHMTLTGMEKFTAVLADYLKANYDLQDRRGQEGYARYDRSVTLFHEAMQKLNEQDSVP